MSFPAPWGAYIAGHANNTTTSLYDFTGNGRNATIGGSGVNIGNNASGNGATASIPYITGTSSTTITWPTGSNSTSFTILAMTRYTTAPYSRILQATLLDFIVGHYNSGASPYSSPGWVGVEYHQQAMTQFSASSPNVSSATNWLVMCSTNGGTTPDNVLVNGVGNGTSTGGVTNASSAFTINTGYAAGQNSNFAFQQLLIWNTSLPAAQMKTISNLVMNYMSTGSITYPWTGGPTFPTPTLGTAPVITSIITSSNSLNVYFNPSTGGSPAPTTYYYSLNGGTTYTNANTTISPITISGVNTSTTYNVALIANNLAGNTAASNIVVASTSYPCFAKGSQILTDGGYTPVETLHPGDLIQTKDHGFVPIWKLGMKTIYHPAVKDRLPHQLYRLSPDRYPSLTEPLVITGCHSILVEEWSSDQEKERASHVHKGEVYITDDRYRLPACADEKAEVHEPAGEYTIYHVSLENEDYFMNYGIYANGLLVESCSKRYLVELSGMKLFTPLDMNAPRQLLL